MGGCVEPSHFARVDYDPSLEPPVVNWFINNLWLGPGKITATFAPEKAGKSRLACWKIAALYAGAERCLGELVVSANKPKGIVYLAGEETIADITGRLKGYLRSFGVADPESTVLPIQFIEAPGMRMDLGGMRYGERGWFEKEVVRDPEVDMIFIDPLFRVHGGKENDNSIMGPMHNDFRRWTNKYGKSLEIIHHTGKLGEEADMNRIATWSRGNSDLATLVDGACFVQVMRESETEEGGIVRLLKLLRAGRFPPPGPMYVKDWGDDIGFSRGVVEE